MEKWAKHQYYKKNEQLLCHNFGNIFFSSELSTGKMNGNHGLVTPAGNYPAGTATKKDLPNKMAVSQDFF